MTDDLVSWLRAELDADEQLYLPLKAEQWQPDGDQWVFGAVSADEIAYSSNAAAIRLIATLGPLRLLAEVQAKRAILDRYEKAAALERGPQAQPVSINTPTARLEKALAEVTAPELRRVVRLLAAVFSDRPGYQENWRP